MFFAILLCALSVLGLDVESVRFQTGMTQIANRILASLPPINLGNPVSLTSVSLDTANKLKQLSNIQVKNVTIGNMSLAAGFDNSTKTKSGLLLSGGKVGVTNAMFVVDAVLESIGPNDTLLHTNITSVATGILNVRVFAPSRTDIIGQMGGKCASKFVIGSVKGAGSGAGAEEKISKALQTHINSVICYGGANASSLYHNVGKTGIEGFLNKTSNMLIKKFINPKMGLPHNPAARAKALTNYTNQVINQVIGSEQMADRNFGAFSLNDIKMSNTQVKEVQFFQTILDPLMPAVNDSSNDTYLKVFAKGVSASVNFKIGTLFGEAAASMDLKPSNAVVAVTFSRDKNNFIVKPKATCSVTLDFSLDVPSQRWNILWQAFLAGFDPMLNNAINSAICSKITGMTSGELTTDVDDPAAEVWNHVVNHTDSQEYTIDDNLFPLWTNHWASKFYNKTTGRHFLPTGKPAVATPAPKLREFFGF